MTALILSELLIYPIKSAAGVSVASAELTPRGLQGDRRFMLVNSDGHFLTQRRLPKMALIQVSFSQNNAQIQNSPPTFLITAPGMNELHIAPLQEGTAIDVDVWGDRTIALSVSAAANTWFSQYLKTDCQLVYMPDSTKRPTEHGKFGPNEIVSFADAYPYLLLTEASLEALNQKLVAKQVESVAMNRFRPNLVIRGPVAPHAEDAWKRIRIGSAIFQVDKACARCSIPNVDPSTGQRTQEPSRTLATYRTRNKEILFGQNLIQENPGSGRLAVGDPVEILA